MSGFFVSAFQQLPQRNQTKVFLSIGLAGLLGVISTLLLAYLSLRQTEKEPYLIEAVPQPNQEQTAKMDLVEGGVTSRETLPPNLVATPDTRVSVNTATATELEALPAIGEKKALKAIEGRPYTSYEDFLPKIALVKLKQKN